MTLRDHGVSAEFVGALRAQGYRRFGTAEIIRLRDHGVTADYLGDLRDLGYSGLTADEIVQLRSYGVTGDFIRQANGGGARRSVEELVRLRTGG